MAALLALLAAVMFALAATLQQKGAVSLSTVSLAHPSSFVGLLRQRAWLLGTLALLAGYVFQAGALNNGRLSVVQPLLVSSVVFVLPLGYWLTDQHVGRREIWGAVAIVLGLSLFVFYGDPSGGTTNASNGAWAVTITIIVVLCGALLALGRGGLARKAAVYGTVAGILYGLSASLAMPTLDYLDTSVSTMLSHWQCYALAIIGLLAFVVQQVSLGTGRLATAVATVSVANPVISVLIGVLLLEETLSRPLWHVAVAMVGLALTFGGAVVISLAREGGS